MEKMKENCDKKLSEGKSDSIEAKYK